MDLALITYNSWYAIEPNQTKPGFEKEGLVQLQKYILDTKQHLFLRLQFWNSGKCRVIPYCHYSQIHSDLEW